MSSTRCQVAVPSTFPNSKTAIHLFGVHNHHTRARPFRPAVEESSWHWLAKSDEPILGYGPRRAGP